MRFEPIGRPAMLVILSAAALVAGVRPAAAGEANLECRWSEQFGASDFWGAAVTMVVWDDGTGEALYAGGYMVTAGGQYTGFVARWDGSSWSPLTGPFGTGTRYPVSDLAVYDDGSGSALYVAASFEAGGLEVASVARWDGSEWSVLPDTTAPGLHLEANELEVFDDGSGPALVASGISYDNGPDVSHLAAWDGTAWSQLGSGVGGASADYPWVFAMTVWDDGSGPALYVGGHFRTAGGVPAHNLARWDGSSWSAVGTPGGAGLDGDVYDLAVYDDGTGPALYAGGFFEHADGVTARGVARWTGSAWTALSPPGLGFRPVVYALTVHDDGTGPALWIGGAFREVGGLSANFISRWDGATLGEPAAGGTNGAIYSMVSWNDGRGGALYVSGALTQAGDTGVEGIARLAGGSWSRLGADVGYGMNGTIYAFASYDDGTGPSLYAGGDFNLAGGSEVYHLARWTGAGWSPLGAAGGPRLGGSVRALAVYDDGNGPALYVGGRSLTLDGVLVPSVLRWDGDGWSLVAPADPLLGYSRGSPFLSPRVYSLGVYDDGTGEALYAGGLFSHVGDLEVNYIARWDGSSWSALGSGLLGTTGVGVLQTWDDGNGPALYVGGGFIEAGGIETRLQLARWDGSNWSTLVGAGGPVLGGSVSALEVFDDGTGSALYAGGTFVEESGPTHIHRIARWDGSHWSPLGDPNTFIRGTGMTALEAFDDGTGPALYVAGGFDRIGDLESRGIARWDGTDWSALVGPSGEGVYPSRDKPPQALAVDPGRSALWVGGSFALAGGVASNYVARWTCDADAGGFQFELMPW